MSSGIYGQRSTRSACIFARSDQGRRSPLTETLDTTEYINGEQMPEYDYLHALGESGIYAFCESKVPFAWRGPDTVE